MRRGGLRRRQKELNGEVTCCEQNGLPSERNLMEMCGKGWLINWPVWRDIIINPSQFYYRASSRASHLLHGPWAPESTVRAVLLPPPHVTIIQNWLEKMKDRLGIVHEIVTKLGTCGMKAGVRKQWPWVGGPSLKLLIGYSGAEGLLGDSCISATYSSSLTDCRVTSG